MLASVSRWRIAESLRSGDDYLSFAQTTLAKHISILRNLGLSELAATSRQQYVTIASELARSLDRLADLRATMRGAVQPTTA